MLQKIKKKLLVPKIKLTIEILLQTHKGVVIQGSQDENISFTFQDIEIFFFLSSSLVARIHLFQGKKMGCPEFESQPLHITIHVPDIEIYILT